MTELVSRKDGVSMSKQNRRLPEKLNRLHKGLDWIEISLLSVRIWCNLRVHIVVKINLKNIDVLENSETHGKEGTS